MSKSKVHGIVELERLTKRGKVVQLVLETPLGLIHITPTTLKYYRDNKDSMVEIHKYGCRIEKHRNAYHDEFDLHDIPWMSVFVDLGEKDLIMIGKSNTDWEIRNKGL